MGKHHLQVFFRDLGAGGGHSRRAVGTDRPRGTYPGARRLRRIFYHGYVGIRRKSYESDEMLKWVMRLFSYVAGD